MILKYKWGTLRKHSYFQLGALVLFAIVLFIHWSYWRHKYLFLVIIGVFGIFFVTNEGIQFKKNSFTYKSNFWNIFDLAKIVLTFSFIVIHFILIKKIKVKSESLTQENEDPNVKSSSFNYLSAYCYALLTLVVWIRIISFLRLFSPTRSLIRLVIEVVKDMTSFFVVMILSLLGLSILLDILSE